MSNTWPVFIVPRNLGFWRNDQNYDSRLAEVAVNEYYLDQFSIDKTVANDKGNKIITYSYKDLFSHVSGSHIPGPSHTYPHLVIVAKSYSTGNEKFTFFRSRWLYQWYHGLYWERGGRAKKCGIGKRSRKLPNCQSPQKRHKKIFYWVQDNISLRCFEDGIAGFQPTAPQEVFENAMGLQRHGYFGQEYATEAGLDTSYLDWYRPTGLLL